MSTPTTTITYSYLRVSSKGQVAGDGFPRQREAIQKWSKQTDHTITEEFTEDGVSGTTDMLSRPALSRLLETVVSLPEGMCATVVVEKADRLARDLIVSELLLRQFNELGVTVIEAEGGNDLTAGGDNPTATLIRQILSAVAEFDKRSTVLKLAQARKRARVERGVTEGRKPYGSLEGERDTLVRMRGFRAKGWPLSEITEWLNEQGRMSRSGKPWTVGSVGRILSREVGV